MSENTDNPEFDYSKMSHVAPDYKKMEERMAEIRASVGECCMSAWFPRLERLDGIRTPKTNILVLGVDYLSELFFGSFKTEEATRSAKHSLEVVKSFLTTELSEYKKLGKEGLFLRTGQTSAKHSWSKSCYLTDEFAIVDHVMTLVEASLMGFPSMPTNVWVARELLPTKPLFTAFHGGMPITEEYRVFIEDGEVKGYIPYWPAEAFESPYDVPSIENWLEVLEENFKDAPPLDQVQVIANEFKEKAWSVDFLKTENGWYVIDMALAKWSYGYDMDRRLWRTYAKV